MKEQAEPILNGVAAFWCITLFAISFGIFNFTSEDRPWWVTLVAYLSAIAGCLALLDVIKWKGTASSGKASSQFNDKLTDEENDLISDYASLVEKRKGFIGRESELPASKEKLHQILNKSKEDPIYRLGLKAIEVNLNMLDNFVPDEEFDTTKNLVEQTMKILEQEVDQKDVASYPQLNSNVSPSQQKALKAILSHMNETLRNLKS